jgi:hypothetical protein
LFINRSATQAGTGFLVLHFGAQRSFLVDILREDGHIRVEWAQDGMPIRPGRFLVASPTITC